jgi:hypothetical protein
MRNICYTNRSFSTTLEGMSGSRLNPFESMILIIETISRKKSYAQILTIDAFYDLIVCKACNIGLPLEWAKGHCVKHRVAVVLSLNVIDLGQQCRILDLVEWKTRKNIGGMSGLDGVGQCIDETGV